EIKPAEDSGVQLIAPDAGRQVLALHRVRYRYEMRRDHRGPFLRVSKDGVGQQSLKTAKGRTVNRMDNDGHARLSRRKPANNPRFAAVGVNDVRMLPQKDLAQSAQGSPICPRPDGAHQFGEKAPPARALGKAIFERGFRSLA